MKLPKQRTPYLTVDIIIHRNDEIVLVKRKRPVKGAIALPGGFVEWGESVENAALREAKEETGLEIEIEGILGVYSAPERDPRGHIATVVFISKPIGGKIKCSDEHLSVDWYKISDLDFSKLAIDHGKILRDYLRYKKEGGTYWSQKTRKI
jgi:8-oxo-dGTP diphosphatase